MFYLKSYSAESETVYGFSFDSSSKSPFHHQTRYCFPSMKNMRKFKRIIYCGGSVASDPHLSGANCAHASLNVSTNNQLERNIYHRLHSGTDVHRYGFSNGELDPIFLIEKESVGTCYLVLTGHRLRYSITSFLKYNTTLTTESTSTKQANKGTFAGMFAYV